MLKKYKPFLKTIKSEIGELERLNQSHEEWRVPFFSYTFC